MFSMKPVASILSELDLAGQTRPLRCDGSKSNVSPDDNLWQRQAGGAPSISNPISNGHTSGWCIGGVEVKRIEGNTQAPGSEDPRAEGWSGSEIPSLWIWETTSKTHACELEVFYVHEVEDGLAGTVGVEDDLVRLGGEWGSSLRGRKGEVPDCADSEVCRKYAGWGEALCTDESTYSDVAKMWWCNW